jgi:hypothetical protein
MRATVCVCLVGVCLGVCGCLSGRPSAPSTFLHLAHRNFRESGVMCLECGVFKCMAEQAALAAWKEACQLAPEAAISRDYKDGFIEGYVDYLDAGGTGEPPAMPPFRYQLHHYQSVPGRLAVQDWFAGFRHGASLAKASGLREIILVPVSNVPCDPPPVRMYTPRPRGSQQDGKSGELFLVPPTPVDTLPAPRPAPPAQPEVGPRLPSDPQTRGRKLLPEPLPIASHRGDN